MAMRGEAQTSSEDTHSFQDLPAADDRALLGESAKQVMKEIIEYSRKVTEFLSNEIKSESRSIAVERLQHASRKLDTFAEALREAAGKLREKQSYSLADVFENCSESVMRLSNKLRESNPDRIIGEMEDFACRQPGIFLGAAVVAGILLGQLFSPSGRREGNLQEIHPRKESSIEYKPGKDEEGYYERH